MLYYIAGLRTRLDEEKYEEETHRFVFFPSYGEAISHPRLSQLLPPPLLYGAPPLFGYTAIYLHVAAMEGSVCISPAMIERDFLEIVAVKLKRHGCGRGKCINLAAAFCCLGRFISRKYFYTDCHLGI